MRILTAVAAASFMISGAAIAQTATESTTTTEQAAPAVPAPGVLSTTHESHAQDGMGDTRDSKSTSYRDSNGAVSQSQSSTTQTAQPVVPPPTTSSTSTTTQSTTTVPPQ